jgi:hypothetical protein
MAMRLARATVAIYNDISVNPLTLFNLHIHTFHSQIRSPTMSSNDHDLVIVPK